jgi:thiol-disulfide isomerase/thioredoxin
LDSDVGAQRVLAVRWQRRRSRVTSRSGAGEAGRQARPGARSRAGEARALQGRLGRRREATRSVDIDGKPLTFKDLRGKVVLIHFWSVYCPVEPQAEIKFKAMAKRYEGKDVVLVAIASNQNEIGAAPAKDAKRSECYTVVREHLKKEGIGYPIYVDHGNKVSDQFQAKSTPHCFVIEQERHARLRRRDSTTIRAATRARRPRRTHATRSTRRSRARMSRSRTASPTAEASSASDLPVRKILGATLALVLIGACLPACGSKAAPAPAVAPAPSIEVVDLAGVDAALARLKGRGVLLNFWAIWCLPCVEELPELMQTAREFQAQGGSVLLVSYDLMVPGPGRDAVRADVAKFAAGRHLDVPILIYDAPDFDAINARFDLPGSIPGDARLRQGRQARRPPGRPDEQGALRRPDAQSAGEVMREALRRRRAATLIPRARRPRRSRRNNVPTTSVTVATAIG